MNSHDISSKTHVCIDELASLLGISEAEVLAYEKLGAIPPSEPHCFPGDTRRTFPRQQALEMWADWKAYCEFLDEEDGTNHANH
ncbi:MAG: hypothetical protein OEV26_00310 [Gallionella sp.]|nr:hypothetical protein [Gallionella sp.]MDH4285852.1 hypothetical protein [Gallionella sp.]